MTITSKYLYAQGTPEDQYRQMGEVVGLTEIFFGIKDLETVLFQQVGDVFYTRPEMEVMEYNWHIKPIFTTVPKKIKPL